MEENLIKRLMTGVKCRVCGQHYGVANINVLGHQEDLWLLSALCPACHTRCLVAAVIREDKVYKVITDLTELELEKFMGKAAPTADELLGMHSFLKDFDGDFSRLFSQE